MLLLKIGEPIILYWNINGNGMRNAFKKIMKNDVEAMILIGSLKDEDVLILRILNIYFISIKKKSNLQFAWSLQSLSVKLKVNL